MTARLCDPDRFFHCGIFIFLRIQVIHRSKQERNIIGVILQHIQVKRIAEICFDVLAVIKLAFKNVKIMLYQFHCSNIIAFFGECDAVSACSGADLRNSAIIAQQRIYISARGEIFNFAETVVCKAAVLVVFVVIVF